ncbi:MAG: hypothetical protein R3C03_11110 [Pirellulaceae bacterium]
MQRRFLLFMTLLVIATMTPFGLAQQVEQTADVRFDFNLKSLRETKTIQSLGFDNSLGQALQDAPEWVNVLVSNGDHIWGMVSLPDSVDHAMQAVFAQKMPVEMIVFVELKDEQAKQIIMDGLNQTAMKTGDEGFYRSKEQGAPENYFFGMSGPKTFVMGTESYLQLRDKAETLASNELNAAWGKSSESALRLVVDASNNADLMQELQANAMAERRWRLEVF